MVNWAHRLHSPESLGSEAGWCAEEKQSTQDGEETEIMEEEGDRLFQLWPE